MNKFLFLLFFISISLFSQKEKDSITAAKIDTLFIVKDSIKKNIRFDLFSDSDLKTIDSLLIDEKFNSSLVDTLEYVIGDKDIIGSQNIVLTTALLKKRLSDLDEQTPFNLAFNPALEKVINSYLLSRSKYYPKLMAKAKYYFPMFEQYLDQYDIPLEMKYLAIVESALRPQVKSRVGATGLWQFMYGTGKQFDLKVSSYVDERQDPVKSTIAACKYLSQLFTIFGDWDLALAAYNSGPGNVRKAIKRSGGYRNYWNIRPYLPKETAGYVPAFYATMYIFEYAEEHGIYAEIPKFFNFQTDTVRVKRTISFDQISEIMNVGEEVISFLNPAYKLDIIPFVKERNYAVRLPSNKLVEFLDKEKELYALASEDESKREKPLPKYFEMDKRIRYRVQNGDYLGKIANKFGVRVSSLKRWNGLKTSRLKIGQRLSVFPKKIPFSVSKVSKKKATISSKSGKYDIYVVKNGDSLWNISKKFQNVSVDEIKKWNNIWSVKSLKPGTKLKIFKS
ncbi:membrane-bound lytic murein transglycosylase D [Polaribacter sp. Hel1_33_78]|uniref:lytic transglycosylase domain-containing protein n=1 Tax=Polaribacter sp. Hel1_33_78 TaxID=1336804 RepID=UPI00087D9420|nr:lytic transglycosylase domain-containing protein [Polaribacter sp. Hel1_33_78]SDU24934.1 membrane-bound lytic murein transglycosylase D [Polaribacter sp. Hel1_33_78]